MYCKPCYEAAKTADVCVAIGGDNYCYNKGKEHWPLERKMKKLGKKMMLWGCSIEPSDVPGELAEHLSNFDVITVRDPISYDALVSGGVTSKLVRCADPAFLLPVERCTLPDGWREGHTVGVNFSPMVMSNIGVKDGTRKAIRELIEAIMASGDSVALIPHVRLSFSDDVDELRPLYEHYRQTGKILLVDDKHLNARQLKYLISNCKFFVGARTHATIAAYSTCVPTLAIGYSVKARGIARDLFGREDEMTISVENLADSNRLVEAYENLYGQRKSIEAELQKRIPFYIEQAKASGIEFGELIKQCRRSV